MNSRRPRISRLAVLKDAVPILLTIAVVLVCRKANGTATEATSYVLCTAIIALSAWYLGIRPAILSAAVAMGLQYWFVAVPQQPQFPNARDLITLGIFLLASTAVILMAEARRQETRKLKHGQAELEVLVKERTTELDTANRSLRDLSARLLQLQDDERRRIARELHDSVGQLLAGLSMNIAGVRSEIERLSKTEAVLTDSENLIKEMSTEVRTISHLLHPPLLDEAGLASAIRWYIEEFARRSNIKIDLDCPNDFGRLPRDVETAMFRVVQECLTNIHRHSGSQTARIHCQRVAGGVLVEIADRGAGIPPEKLAQLASTGAPSVGIRGMKERLRQLGGNLEITSGSNGTTIAAQIPALEPLLSSWSPIDTSKAAA